MVSKEKIFQKFSMLDDYLNILNQIARNPVNIFIKDKILLGSAKYYLQVSIECCLDVANHIIASERLRAPKDYADSFKVIEEEGIVSAALGNRLQQMAKFRNRLVHLYGDIDDKNVFEYINKDVKDLVEFKALIIKRFGK